GAAGWNGRGRPGFVWGGRLIGHSDGPWPIRPQAGQRAPANPEADMSFRAAFSLAAAIVLSTPAIAAAASKKQKVPRGSGSQPQAVAPRSAAPFNPYSPSLTGAGSPGYNQSLMTWR